jgi:hypothetical protein
LIKKYQYLPNEKNALNKIIDKETLLIPDILDTIVVFSILKEPIKYMLWVFFFLILIFLVYI